MLKQPLSSGEYGTSLPDVLVDGEVRPENPFPGLRPFSLEECHLFFGREGQADEILVKLGDHRFVTVMGYSGSGKSSLMYCGLLPVLYGGFMTQTGPNWTAIITRPGNSPIRNLTDSILDFLVGSGRISQEDRNVHDAIISSVLKSGPTGLIEVSRFLQQDPDENIFFLIDQFEEIFRFRENVGTVEALNESQSYVSLVLTAVAQTKVPAYVALTMRSDFIGSCSVFPSLTELINRSNYLVPQMTREQKKMVVEGPVAVGGGRITQRLVKRLLRDVGNDQDQLPILQHALMRTWDYWRENREPGEPIDLRHYNAVGRIHEALSQHANEAYDELNSKHKLIAETLFKNVTEKGQDNRGTRRPARLGLVAELAEVEEEDVIFVVDHFRKPGRSFLMPGANVVLDADSMIELSHESLMRIWKRLDVWVDEEFDSAQMYKRLSEAAAMYQIGKTGLWRPPDLQLALNWQKKQNPTREWAQRYDEAFERAIVFLDTSRITYEAELKNQEMMQRRVLRRTRATAVILGIAFVVAIGLFFFSYVQRIAAETQRIIAEEAKIAADDARMVAEQNRLTAEEQTRLARIAEQNLRESNFRLEETLEKLREAYQQTSIARAQAEQSLLEANAARDTAQAQRLIAQDQYNRAESALGEANRLLMLTVAQNLAAKSVQEVDDKDLAGLLAMQGYRFHTRFKGDVYDPYVYEGLYTALTKLNGNPNYNAIESPGPAHVHIKSVEVSAHEHKFYSAGADGRIMVGDYQTLKSTPTGWMHPYPSKSIALSRDERYVIHGSDSSALQVYDLTARDSKPSHVITGLAGATNDIESLPDNSGFVVAKAGGAVYVVNHLNGESKRIVTLSDDLKAISVSPDGNTLAGGTWSGKLILIDLTNGSHHVVTDDDNLRILSVKFSPDGKNIAFGVDDKANRRGQVRIYTVATGDFRQMGGHRAGVNDVEFSPDGKLLATAGADKRLLLWILDSPEDLPVVMDNNNGFIWDVAFSPDSDYLIAACSESEIRVWPTNPRLLAEQICPKVTRNMTMDEWRTYVGQGKGFEYEPTCVNVLINKY